MKRRAWLLFALFAILVGWRADSASTAKEAPPRLTHIDLNIFAAFLGPQPTGRQTTVEPILRAVDWNGPNSGRAVVRLWRHEAYATFERDAAGRIRILSLTPITRSKGDPWDVWRHRHAYLLDRGEYVWNSLDDVRERMAPDKGDFFDRYLRLVWVMVLERQLKAIRPGEEYRSAEPAKPTLSSLPVRVRYNDKGLVGSTPVHYTFFMQELPVRVSFDVVASTQARPGGWGITFRDGIRWTYDKGDMRGRYGYRRAFWGGYRWDRDMPGNFPKTDTQGLVLDELLDRTVAYWVDATAQQFMADFNDKLIRLISHGGPT